MKDKENGLEYNLDIQEYGEVTVFRIIGEAPELTSENIKTELNKRLKAGNNYLVFDLSKTTDLDRKCLAVLAYARRIAQQNNGNAVFYVDPDQLSIQNIIEEEELRKKFDIYPSLESAIHSYQNMTKPRKGSSCDRELKDTREKSNKVAHIARKE